MGESRRSTKDEEKAKVQEKLNNKLMKKIGVKTEDIWDAFLNYSEEIKNGKDKKIALQNLDKNNRKAFLFFASLGLDMLVTSFADYIKKKF